MYLLLQVSLFTRWICHVFRAVFDCQDRIPLYIIYTWMLIFLIDLALSGVCLERLSTFHIDTRYLAGARNLKSKQREYISCTVLVELYDVVLPCHIRNLP